ncbi:hypothetical protein PQR02_02830 [Paraburkholderia sediminicola]|uniref:Uncharacterized protein n=1 Tax=Paraburkholderia rhynchosiae TaxID=487049 RepID=A0ACC7N539_9BURK
MMTIVLIYMSGFLAVVATVLVAMIRILAHPIVEEDMSSQSASA